MEIPFTVEQFFGVFADYNTTLWPAQVILTGVALAAMVLVLVPHRWADAAVSAILAALWVWIALAYHLAFFTSISPPAYALQPCPWLAPLSYSGRALSGAGSSSAGCSACKRWLASPSLSLRC